MRKTHLIAQMIRDAYAAFMADDLDNFRDEAWFKLNASAITFGVTDAADFDIHVDGNFYNVHIKQRRDCQ